jgi:membrane protease YdiL (CAAX protease family)
VLSEKKWKLESVLRLVMGVLICQSIGALLLILLRGNVDPNAAPSVGRTIVGALSFQLITISLAWRFLREHQVGWLDGFGLRRDLPRAIGLGAMMVGLFLPVGWGLMSFSVTVMKKFGIEPSLQLAMQALKNSSSTMQLVALGIATIILAPIAEEILFRGVLYRTIKQHGFPRAALWGTSVLFALIHFNVAIFVPLLLLALLLVWLYEKTDNLLAPIAAHATFNAVNFAMFFLKDDIAKKLSTQS